MYDQGVSAPKISKHFGMERTWAYRRLKAMGITRRSNSESHQYHSINTEFFDTVTPASAYWIGFLAADGNVSNNLVQIDLMASDGGHLEKFRLDLQSTHPVKYRTIAYPQARFAFYNEHIASVLRGRYGFGPDKSHTYAPPVALAHNRDFWRGVIDGDGSLYESGGKLHIALTGSEAICQAFLEWVKAVVATTTTVKKGHGNCFAVRLSGVGGVQRIAKELYQDSNGRALDRKMSIYTKWTLRKPKFLRPIILSSREST